MRAKNTNKMRQFSSLLNEHWKRKQRLKASQLIDISRAPPAIGPFPTPHLHLSGGSWRPAEVRSTSLVLAALTVLLLQLAATGGLGQQTVLQSDPRPTIYSGQVSFGLLLSAHSSMGAELTSSASYQVATKLEMLDAEELANATGSSLLADNASTLLLEPTTSASGEEAQPRRMQRQIFERTGQHRRQQALQQQQAALQASAAKAAAAAAESLASGLCSQVNPNALFAGMGAIWASHQANLVGDSHLAIGTYIYDSCNDLDVGQRQSVRIVSNLNAFQQTTCESPRGAPISLTIAHGDNQLRAIQLLTSFRVPVITTKEHFDLEDYSQLTRDQKRFLFSTAPSSRHLAVGSLRFGKRIVSRSTNSPKLPNAAYKMSSRNGLIVISRNLPPRFIAYLSEVIPVHVNYEMLQSSQPIDQIRSVEALESILASKQAGSSSSAGDSAKRRRKRDDSDGSGEADDESAGEPENNKMLSPTILMFITPSEAIDLVTRLRNDLAEVSRYYSLIVATREDISPALKTIFHRGGSRLCSGKAFYTISPKPDDISEFSRYFRDTVQVEAENSDHPLICEFAKYQASTRVAADLDEISTEPVIKAVWTAAAAFKSVHRRECSSFATGAPMSNTYRAAGSASASTSASDTSTGEQVAGGETLGRQLSSRQSGKSAHADCMVKMNKNMATLVQRAIKRLDVNINSTGLQSLDGFRIKFDELNELMTNKFSIKYINKECEITEIGQYSGLKDSNPRLDEESLSKSLESTLPDPWPVRPPPPPSPPPPSSPPTVAASPSSSEPATEPGSKGEASSASDGSEGASGDSSDAAGSGSSSTPASSGLGAGRGKRKLKSREPESSSADDSGKLDDEEPPDIEEPPSKRTPSKRSRISAAEEKAERLAKRKARPIAAPVTAMGGRGVMPGVSDTDPAGGDLGLTSSGSKLHAQHPTARTNQRRLKPFPTSTTSGSLRDWLPNSLAPAVSPTTRASTAAPTRTPSFMTAPPVSSRILDDEQVDAGADLKTRATTSAPIYSTLPESGGNADLEPTSKATGRVPKSTAQETAATSASETADYVTSPSISKNSFEQGAANSAVPRHLGRPGYAFDHLQRHGAFPPDHNASGRIGDESHDVDSNRVNYFKDLNSAPVPLSSTSSQPIGEPFDSKAEASKAGRTTLRSNLRWLYGSWFGISILAANICGALLTLYVLTFLLLKNCDGSLDRENQGMRSMHLLSIIVVFFGSTLFIVYPTPGLCLLRTSWHNFALVMLFGSLLLHAMQTRSLSTLGLGGRPNRLNQFLTLVFMVGVQVSFELQRWKYESANYMNFVSQYFGPGESSQRLALLSNAIGNQFNPLNAFNGQATPVSIQVSEQYQNLLQDYCLQRDDFLASQIYLCLLVGLLVGFSAGTRGRRARRLLHTSQHKLGSHHLATSGKLVASQHEANLDMAPSHFGQFAPNAIPNGAIDTGNVFLVALISAPIYSLSVVLHLYSQNGPSRDLISSVSMILIAFVALLGIFLPILLQIHRFGGLLADGRLPGSLSRPVITQSKLPGDNSPSSPSTAFTMFPEFAPTGLRRPSSDSSSGSRRPFVDTKESRRNMRAALANLGPTTDSLRSMGFYGPNCHEPNTSGSASNAHLDPSLLNLKLNLSANANEHLLDEHHEQSKHRRANNPKQSEKRLIMLDVDPCCPRHGHQAARPAKPGEVVGTSHAKTRNSRGVQ